MLDQINKLEQESSTGLSLGFQQISKKGTPGGGGGKSQEGVMDDIMGEDQELTNADIIANVEKLLMAERKA